MSVAKGVTLAPARHPSRGAGDRYTNVACPLTLPLLLITQSYLPANHSYLRTHVALIYVVGHIGNAFVMDSDYEADGTTLTATMEPLGLYGSGAVGLDWDSGFSTEVALSYQSADLEDLALTGLDGFSGFSVNLTDVEGSMSALSLRPHVLYGLSPFFIASRTSISTPM